MSIEGRQARVLDKKAKELFKHLSCYIFELEGKNKQERKEIFDSYNMRWRDYCRSTNTRSLVDMNEDGFKNMATDFKYVYKRYKLKVLYWKKHPTFFGRWFRAIKSNLIETSKQTAA